MDNAQPTEATPDASTNGADGAQATPTKDGAQQRIDQLTAQLHDERRAREAAQIAANEAMAANARMLGQTAPPPPPAVPEFNIPIPDGMDPAQAAFFQNLTKGFQAQLAAQAKATEVALGRIAGQSAAQTAQLALNQKLTAEPAEVQELAVKLMNTWQREQKSGWLPEDAISFARYNLGLPNTRAPRREAAPNGNADDQLTPGGAPPPPVAAGVKLAAALPDAVLARMTPAAQEAYWAKRVAAQSNGHVDSPIIYD